MRTQRSSTSRLEAQSSRYWTEWTAIVHLGSISVEAQFNDLRESNIRGLYNLYSAAQKQGVQRVVYASSNHAVGFHPVTSVLATDAPLHPDYRRG